MTRKNNLSPDEYAAAQATLWREGLAAWGQDGERIRRLKHSAGFTIYTPGSTAGVPVSILRSFSAPPREIIQDTELLSERVTGTTSSLLGLIGLTADPVQSREHILVSNILFTAWQHGIDLDLPTLIHQISEPPFDQIGVMSLESFFPAGERFKLAMRFNSLLAAPGFAPWMQGESLDIDNILYTSAGKPRISIFSIAHLSDAERMFFVSLLLNEVLSWTRVQPGTTSLRAILYMDEIAGYFPPVANPPSKAPLLACSNRHGHLVWAYCLPPRTRWTLTTRDCQTQEPGLLAGFKQSVTKCVCWMGWKERPSPREWSLTGVTWTKSSLVWAKECS